jgi:SET domain-containing protein
MLLVSVEARPSPIHGLGLFALERIPTGTAVWRFTHGFDLLIGERDLSRLSATEQAHVLHFAYLHAGTRTFVLSSDDDRFTNHADHPNTVPQGGWTVAVREIRPGDEITIDYSLLHRLDFRAGPGSVHTPPPQGRRGTGPADGATGITGLFGYGSER